MSLDLEKLRVQLGVHAEFNAPDDLSIENVGESLDAQLAVQGLENTLEARKKKNDEIRLAEAFVTQAISAMPETNCPIDTNSPNDLALARRIQTRVLWYGEDRLKEGQYIVGKKVDGDRTDLLLIPQREEKLSQSIYDQTYMSKLPVRGVMPIKKSPNFNSPASSLDIRADSEVNKPWCIRTVDTEVLNCVLAAAHESESLPFSEDELQDMNEGTGLNILLDGRALNSIRLWPSGWYGHKPIRHKGALPLLKRERDITQRTPLVILGNRAVYSFAIKQIVEEFGVLEHIVDLATALDRTEEIEKIINPLLQK